MANLKLRGERDSVDAKGPSSGSAQDMNIGSESIQNCPAEGRQVPYPSTGPRTLPKSSLGARQMKKYSGGPKA